MGVLIGLLGMLAVALWVTTPWPENLWGLGVLAGVSLLFWVARWIGRDGPKRDRWREAEEHARTHRRKRSP